MLKAVTSREMKELDRRAEEEYGIPSITLMENAGRASAEEILKRFKKGKAAIFCGKGNNGGDGFVCARHLRQKGIKTDIFIVAGISEIKNKDPLINLNILKKSGVNIKEIITIKDVEKIKRNFRYDFIVDAIFGIGFSGALPEKIAKIVNFLNGTRKPIYAVDVPSGLDATRGTAGSALCVTAYKTITFGLPKTGFSHKEAKSYLGRLIVKDIGFPIKLLKR